MIFCDSGRKGIGVGRTVGVDIGAFVGGGTVLVKAGDTVSEAETSVREGDTAVGCPFPKTPVKSKTPRTRTATPDPIHPQASLRGSRDFCCDLGGFFFFFG